MRIRTGLAAAATAAALLTTTATAVAAPSTYTARGTATGAGHTLLQTATGQQTASTPASKTIAVTCTATALPDGAATAVTDCYLLGADGRRFDAGANDAAPGPVDVARGSLTVPLQSYVLCVRSTALFVRDGFRLTATTSCSAPA